MSLRFGALSALLVCASSLLAQAPTGTIRGVILDASQAAVPGAKLTLENTATRLTRAGISGPLGDYVFASLPPGTYRVQAEAPGFRLAEATGEVFVGRELAINFTLEVAAAERQMVAVESQASQVNPTEYKVEGVVSHQQIEDMPLNGRNALELARLQPGVVVSSGVPSGKNSFVNVSIGGETSAATRVTVDGGSVNDNITGGVWQNFSQEVVQEFQVSLSNFDPSTGITSAGAINIITRSGSNDFHGSVFGYWRDSSFAANPELRRDPIDPDPRFNREQYGYLASGPAVKDRLFWLTSLERTRQRGVSVLDADNVDLLAFNSIKKEPFDVMLQTHKLDWNPGTNHHMNLRYSRDGNEGRAGGGLIENQRVNRNSADQYLFNYTWTAGPRFVNDYRIQFNKYSNYYTPTPESMAMGMPSVSIRQSNVTMGMDNNSPQSTLLGRLEMNDNIVQQLGRHSLKYGASFERSRGRGSWQYSYPASITLYSPAEARAAGIPVPATFTTRQDLLQLPVRNFEFGVGNPAQPAYHPEEAAVNHRARFYFGDSWKAASNLTVSLALSYSFETNLLNSDIPKPKSLAPLLHGDTAPTRRDRNNIAPMVGFAWSPGKSNKTVVRGGFGIYYDTFQAEVKLIERIFEAPAGVGYVPLTQDQVPDPTKPSRSLSWLVRGPSPFRGASLLQYMSIFRPAFEAELAKGQNNEDLSFTNVDLFGTAYGICDPQLTTPYSMQYSLGVQHEFPGGILLSADGEFKQSVHQIFQADYNKNNRVGGNVIPSMGSVLFFQSGGTAQYKALLMRAEKHFQKRYQFIASYAFSSFVGLNSNGLYLGSDATDNNNWKDSFGPQGTDHRHRLVLAGTVDLPWRMQASVISEMMTRAPGNLYAGNYDYNGDGTFGDRLPGTAFGQVNRSISESDIPGLVASFNSQYAGKRDAQGQIIQALPALPASYALGGSTVSQDLRLTKIIHLGERFQIHAIGEVFNVLNIANLGGFSTDLSSTTFGQPTSRMSSVFGSGGPRAFQFALRFSF